MGHIPAGSISEPAFVCGLEAGRRPHIYGGVCWHLVPYRVGEIPKLVMRSVFARFGFVPNGGIEVGRA